MIIECVWEHNGDDTLLYAVNLPGAYTRGETKAIALQKMVAEARDYLAWAGETEQEDISARIVQESACDLQIRDADSDVLFDAEKAPLTMGEYIQLKELALRSAADFLALYESVPDKQKSVNPVRSTFYGQVPRTAEEMYQHTKNVNAYYFGEIDVQADNEGTILDCRRRGFEVLESKPDFLNNPVVEGSYGESWTLRKVLRRFIWHDRIHARAMCRMAKKTFGKYENIFKFEVLDMSFNFTIEAMLTPSDIEGKAYVHYKSWHETYSGLIDHAYLETITQEFCAGLARRWPEDTLVAKEGDKVLGFVCYGPCRDEDLESAGEVMALYVLKEYHGRRLGYELMRAAMAKLRGYKKLVVWVLKGNEHAISFYEKYGFQFDGTVKEISMGTPAKVLRMVLETPKLLTPSDLVFDYDKLQKDNRR